MNRIVHKLTSALLSILMVSAVAALPVLAPAAKNPCVSHAATTFSDISGHWAKNYIQKAVALGIVNGYSDGTFRPESNVTRAEFTKMLNTTLGNNGTVNAVFSDVSSEQWFYQDVCKGVAASFVNGYSEGTFCPDNSITRQEAAVILARVIPAAGVSDTLASYTDANEIANWARNSMEKIVGKSYMTGADKTLTPTASLTRGQAAKIIVELSQGENIIKNNQTIVKDQITIKDTIYSNQISVGSQVAEGIATLNNCVILGNVNVLGGGSAESQGVVLNNSRVSKLTVARGDGPVLISAAGESTVVSTYIDESAVLREDSGAVVKGDFGKGFVDVFMNRKSDLDIKGNLEQLLFLESKCDARIRTGSRINAMTVGKDASRCNIVLEEGSAAGTVDVRGINSVLEGKGSVDELNVYADGLVYQPTPKRLTVDKSVEVLPVQNIDPSEALRITVDPADGATGIAVNEGLKITFTSSVHATDSTGKTLTDEQAESLIQLKKGGSTGPNVAFSAKVGSNGTSVTITPENSFSYGTVYCIKIGREDLTDEYGNTNDLFLSSFTTEKLASSVQPNPSGTTDTDNTGTTSSESSEEKTSNTGENTSKIIDTGTNGSESAGNNAVSVSGDREQKKE